ncbi:MAG TPA: isocitrate/isopropylmalate family dehydrogenase [Acidimicrobiales bacterium]|nr:isocitrate/isopropylmalate family dehydrogenase [Acidimicrobiales bacterium]
MPAVVVIEGEDAAPEVVRPAVRLVDALGTGIEWVRPPVGAAATESHGSLFPDEARAAIDAADATFFGSTSGPSAPALFYLRWGKKTFANVRPIRWMPGARTPFADASGIDFVIVRENLEDLYLGLEGDLTDLAPLGFRHRDGTPVVDHAPGRYAVKVITEAATRDVVTAAFELARRRTAAARGRSLVTVGTKHNMLRRSDGYFREVALDVARAYPDIEVESYIVDDLARRIVADPKALDVVVLPNLYGDILSDAAAGLVGGLGVAPSGCYGHDYAYFEPSHGTAPDIAGKGVINPTAQILSAAMLVEHLGFVDEARRLERAVERVYAEGTHLTPDQGGSASTEEMADAIGARL